MEQNASQGHDFIRPMPLPAANFPIIAADSSDGAQRFVAIRGHLEQQGEKQNGRPSLVVRLEELDRPGESGTELFPLPVDWIPGAVKVLNPGEPMKRIGLRQRSR